MVTPSTAEVVRLAGGWLFDQVMAGWDVWVLTADQANPRPLRILGVRPCDLDGALTALVAGPWPEGVAAHEDLYRSDARVRQLVHGALAEGLADVRLWGDEGPPDLGAGAVQHRLSVAARAFKAQALAAAAAPADPSGVTEVFRRGELLQGAERELTLRVC